MRNCPALVAAISALSFLLLILACGPKKAPEPVMVSIRARVPIPGPFDAAAPMVSAGALETANEVVPGSKPTLARDEMKNVPAMGEVPVERFMAAMLALKGAIGAECKDCHPDEKYESDQFLPKRRSRQMIQMSVAINENWFEKQSRVTCFTCHRGRWTPSPDPSLTDRMRAPRVPVALLEDSEQPAASVFKNVQVFKDQSAGELLKKMSLWTAAIGVECDYCHLEAGKWEREDVVQKQVTREMVAMTARINETWFGGEPVVTCFACHQGQQIPSRAPDVVAESVPAN